MNWIDMSDKDKLYHYAKEFVTTSFRIEKSNDHAGSYYIDCEGDNNIHGLAIMEYDLGNLVQFKKCLADMWSHAGFQDADLLATIVSATAFKNIPAQIEQDILPGKPVEKESYESISAEDAPPVFIYEF